MTLIFAHEKDPSAISVGNILEMGGRRPENCCCLCSRREMQAGTPGEVDTGCEGGAPMGLGCGSHFLVGVAEAVVISEVIHSAFAEQ